MKGYTDFAMGFLGPEAVATKPIGSKKFMDWNKVQKIVDEHPNSVIYAGLMEDWNDTSGLIFAKGKYYDGYVYGCSVWATPIVDVDGEEIECWTYEETEEGSSKPRWWGNGQTLLDEWDFEDANNEDEVEDSTGMTFYIGESGSSGRKFDSEDDFINAIRELIDTYRNNGEDWFEVQVAND